MSLLSLIRKDHWPLYVAIVVLLVPVLLLGYHLLQETGGTYSLPRDEAFLQLSTAKTLAFYRIWGIDKHSFAAASPSLLYPVTLAVCFFVFGAHLVITSVVNLVAAGVLLVMIQRWLMARAIKPLMQLFVLLGVVLLTPLPYMVIYGMERMLLLLFAFLFISRISDEWNLAEFSRRTLIYGALMVASRYDGVMLIGIVCLLLIWHRRWLAAFELALWSLLPVLVFGIFAIWKGSYFLPNTFFVSPAGSQFSYDWLVGCGLAVGVPLLSGWNIKHVSGKKVWVVGIAGLLIIFILITSNLYAFREAGRSSVGIYNLDYQAGRFMHRYYNKWGIISDDMGVLSYLTEGRYLDLSGMASVRVARGRTVKPPNPESTHQLIRAQSIFFAILSDQYDEGLPKNWIKVATWEITGDFPIKKRLFFYAVDSSMANGLKTNMNSYRESLINKLPLYKYL